MSGHPRFHEILKELGELHDKKNTDYAAGGLQGHLGNFERVAYIMQLYGDVNWTTPFGVAMVYLLKQLDAMLILYATRRESVTGEPIDSRLKDVAVYSIIGMILAEELHRNELSDEAAASRPSRYAGGHLFPDLKAIFGGDVRSNQPRDQTVPMPSVSEEEYEASLKSEPESR